MLMIGRMCCRDGITQESSGKSDILFLRDGGCREDSHRSDSAHPMSPGVRVAGIPKVSDSIDAKDPNRIFRVSAGALGPRLFLGTSIGRSSSATSLECLLLLILLSGERSEGRCVCTRIRAQGGVLE